MHQGRPSLSEVQVNARAQPRAVRASPGPHANGALSHRLNAHGNNAQCASRGHRAHACPDVHAAPGIMGGAAGVTRLLLPFCQSSRNPE